jgi:deoxycytidylate deaminase
VLRDDHQDWTRQLNRQDRGLRAAVNAAKCSNAPTYKVGASLSKGSRVISVGWNWFRKTSPNSLAYLRTVHAELHCIHGFHKEDLSGCVLTVARITNGGLISIAKPCAGCQEMLKALGIKKVFYTNRKGELEVL